MCLCLQPFFCVLYPDFMTKTSVCVINATAVLCAVQLSRLTRICYSSWFFGKRQFFHSARLFTLTMFWDLCLKCLVLWFVHVFLIVETMFKDFCLNCAGFPSMPIRIRGVHCFDCDANKADEVKRNLIDFRSLIVAHVQTRESSLFL